MEEIPIRQRLRLLCIMSSWTANQTLVGVYQMHLQGMTTIHASNRSWNMPVPFQTNSSVVTTVLRKGTFIRVFG